MVIKLLKRHDSAQHSYSVISFSHCNLQLCRRDLPHQYRHISSANQQRKFMSHVASLDPVLFVYFWSFFFCEHLVIDGLRQVFLKLSRPKAKNMSIFPAVFPHSFLFFFFFFFGEEVLGFHLAKQQETILPVQIFVNQLEVKFNQPYLHL